MLKEQKAKEEKEEKEETKSEPEKAEYVVLHAFSISQNFLAWPLLFGSWDRDAEVSYDTVSHLSESQDLSPCRATWIPPSQALPPLPKGIACV